MHVAESVHFKIKWYFGIIQNCFIVFDSKYM